MTTRVDAYDVIRRDALGGIERRRLQPERELAEVRSEVERAVDDYQRRARLGEELPLGDPVTMVHRVLRSVTDFGPLTDLLARRDVEEIFVEGPRVTYLDTTGSLARARRTDERRREPPDGRPPAGDRPNGSSTPSSRSCRHASSTAPRG